MRKPHARRSHQRRPRQQLLPLARSGRGGARAGAGRKPNGLRAGVRHRPRPPVSRHHPIHITTHVHRDLRSLRGKATFHAVREALRRGSERPGFRVVEFSVMRNHLHLMCEADSRATLARGMQGLLIRIARALNRELGRRGQVFRDRYHDRVLKTPSEVRNALAYVLNNARRHAAVEGRKMSRGWLDPCSSAPAFHGRVGAAELALTASPQTWLLARGWQRAGPVQIDEVPGGSRARRRAPRAHGDFKLAGAL